MIILFMLFERPGGNAQVDSCRTSCGIELHESPLMIFAVERSENVLNGDFYE